MKKNKAGKSRRSEKEYKKKRFFAMDDDYDDEDYDDEDEDYDDEDEDYEDDEDDEVDDEEDYDDEDEDDDYEDDDEEDDDDDEEDDDDDEEDDEEDDEDYEDDEIDDNKEKDSGWSSKEARRARRRARRIRNQILAYLLVIILAAGGLFGCFLGGRKIVQKFQADKQEKELQEQLAALQEMEEDPVIDLDAAGEEESQSGENVLSPLDEIVTARITEMPIEDKVAALFMVTPEQLTGVPAVTKAGETTKEALTKYKVGGLVYTENNINGADQLKELLSNTALIDQTLFLAVAEEGGENSVVASKLSVAEVQDMASIGASGDANSAYQAGSDTGTYLAEYGFNLNLAPVADVKTSEESILGNRSFGSDAAQTGEMAASYIRGLTEKGVSACVKTFPGFGGVTKSTAEGMADTARSQSDMESAEFPAYQTAIAAGSEFVMVGTMSAPELTGDNTPCCLSYTAVDLLRNSLGFDGIILTGALNEKSITEYHTSAEAAEMALKAGVDMIYMPENFEEAYAGVLQAVQNGSLEESRIDESLLRIYRVKYKDRVDSVLGGDGVGMENVPETEDGSEDTPAE